MGRKPSTTTYVIGQAESSSAHTQTTRNFSVTLTERDWVLTDFFAEEKVLTSLENHLNSAVVEYLDQLTSCLNGSKKRNARASENSGKEKKPAIPD